MCVPTCSTSVVLIPASVQTPRLPQDLCDACEHGWVFHRRVGAPPFHSPTDYMTREGYSATNCGGYYSVRTSIFSSSRLNFLKVLRFPSRIIAGHSPPSVFAPLSGGHTMRVPLQARQLSLGSECNITTVNNAPHPLMRRYSRPMPVTTSGQPSRISMHPLTDHSQLIALGQPILAYQALARAPSATAPLAPIRTAHRQGARAGPAQANTNVRRTASYQRHNAESAADNAVAGSSSGLRRSGPPKPFPRTEVPVPEDQELYILCLPYCVSTFAIECSSSAPHIGL